MKKIIISLIFFFSFFNGVYPNGYLDTNLYDTDEATIEIESARLDENNLQISWLVSGLENIDEVIISVRELTSDGLQGEPLEIIDYSDKGQKIIQWDGTTDLSIILKILSNAKKNQNTLGRNNSRSKLIPNLLFIVYLLFCLYSSLWKIFYWDKLV